MTFTADYACCNLIGAANIPALTHKNLYRYTIRIFPPPPFLCARPRRALAKYVWPARLAYLQRGLRRSGVSGYILRPRRALGESPYGYSFHLHGVSNTTRGRSATGLKRMKISGWIGIRAVRTFARVSLGRCTGCKILRFGVPYVWTVPTPAKNSRQNRSHANPKKLLHKVPRMRRPK